ncbi:MAG: hypothetical protein HQ532_00170 [Candidatus Omnitrophica bacterium]|nr:hypothetical protein [Candidatus Omnitrophota bacterium]
MRHLHINRVCPCCIDGYLCTRHLRSCPGKETSTIAEVAFRALLAATLACLLTACVAGTFFTDGSILLGK